MDLFLARPMMHAFGAKPRIVTVDVNPTPCKSVKSHHWFKLHTRPNDPNHTIMAPCVALVAAANTFQCSLWCPVSVVPPRETRVHHGGYAEPKYGSIGMVAAETFIRVYTCWYIVQ